MDALHTSWADVPKEHLIPLLTRQAVKGEKSMVAKVCLEKGCIVKIHHHESEQVSVMVTGRARWTVGSNSSNEFREFEMVAGEVLVLPSNTPHGLEVLEDAEFIDILSPIGPMGVDTQKD
jgi:quercetin dioxygenase-like cupin family protein